MVVHAPSKPQDSSIDCSRARSVCRSRLYMITLCAGVGEICAQVEPSEGRSDFGSLFGVAMPSVDL
jgi:hypothetical protein